MRGSGRRPTPPAATVPALAYYRADDRFSPATSATRVSRGTERAATHGPDLLQHFTATAHSVTALCSTTPPTRVVEVAVHGFDLAAALHRPPRTTPPAITLLTTLFGPDPIPTRTPLTYLHIATGRLPLPPDTHPGPNWPILS